VALQAIQSVRAATHEAIIPAYAVDAPRDARTPVIASTPSPLLFDDSPGRAQVAGPGNHHMPHPHLLRRLLQSLGVQSAVARDQPWGLAHHRAVMLDGRPRLVDRGCVGGAHVEARDDPARDLVEDDLTAELHRGLGLAPLPRARGARTG